MKEELTKRIDALNDELAARQESIDLLKGRLKSQITSFKETIVKVLDKDTSLGEKNRTLFREQGITVASIFTAIRMAIGVLVEALLPGGGGAISGGGEPPPKDEKGLKEWVRSKLKALASLLGKLGMKAAEALPGIIGGIDALNDELAARQESIDLLKGRLKSQITSFKETIVKVLDKDTSLGEKNRTLFREQGITVASIFTAIRMAIGVLVEALLPGGGGAISGGGEPPPKDEKGLKEWVRSKLKALASLLGKLGMKAAEALPGIIGGIISWILNRAKDVVGWVSQNLWALVVGIGGLIYTYIVTRK